MPSAVEPQWLINLIDCLQVYVGVGCALFLVQLTWDRIRGRRLGPLLGSLLLLVAWVLFWPVMLWAAWTIAQAERERHALIRSLTGRSE